MAATQEAHQLGLVYFVRARTLGLIKIGYTVGVDLMPQRSWCPGSPVVSARMHGVGYAMVWPVRAPHPGMMRHYVGDGTSPYGGAGVFSAYG